jgi:hypothetical protein
MPFAVDDAEGARQIFQVPGERAREVAGLGAVRSGDGDLLVPLVPKSHRVLVEPLSIEFAVVLEGGDRVPAVVMRGFHQPCRRIPGIVQHIHRQVARQQRLKCAKNVAR